MVVAHSEDFQRESMGQGPMRLEDVATGQRLMTFPTLKGQTWPMLFSPDDRLLASSNFVRPPSANEGETRPAKMTLRLWETATAAEVLSLPAADFNRAAFSADSRLLALSAPAQQIVVWDLAIGRELRRYKGFDAGGAIPASDIGDQTHTRSQPPRAGAAGSTERPGNPARDATGPARRRGARKHRDAAGATEVGGTGQWRSRSAADTRDQCVTTSA